MSNPRKICHSSRFNKRVKNITLCICEFIMNSASRYTSTSSKRSIHGVHTLEFGSIATTADSPGNDYNNIHSNEDIDESYECSNETRSIKRPRHMSSNNNDDDNLFNTKEASHHLTIPSETDAVEHDKMQDDCSYDVCGVEFAENENDPFFFTTIYDLIGVPLRLLVAEIPTSSSSGSSNTQGSFLSASPASTFPGFGSYTPGTPNSGRQTTTQQQDMGNRRQRRRRPLLSRSEAACLLQINLLAQQIDALTSITAQAMQEKMEYECLSSKIGKNPYLLPVLSVVRQHSIAVPHLCLEHIEGELSGIIQQLQRSVQQLQQFAEQNWNLANTLAEDVDAGMIHPEAMLSLGRIKEKLSTIQLEICSRIGQYIATATTETQSADSLPISMREFCFNEIPFLNDTGDDQAECKESIERELQFTSISKMNATCNAVDEDGSNRNNSNQHRSPSPDLPLSSPELLMRIRNDDTCEDRDSNKPLLHRNRDINESLGNRSNTIASRKLWEAETDSQQTAIPAALLSLASKQRDHEVLTPTMEDHIDSDKTFTSPSSSHRTGIATVSMKALPSPIPRFREFCNRGNSNDNHNVLHPSMAASTLAARSGENTRESEGSNSSSSDGQRFNASTSYGTSSSTSTCRIQNTAATTTTTTEDSTITASQYDAIDFLSALSRTVPPQATTLGSSSSS